MNRGFDSISDSEQTGPAMMDSSSGALREKKIVSFEIKVYRKKITNLIVLTAIKCIAKRCFNTLERI